MAEIEREAVVRYLLGEGSEAECEALERSLFEDESAAEQVEILEDELVDDYVAGRLAPDERKRFEKAYFTSPERAAKVEFARALARKLSALPASRAFARLLPLAAAVLLAVAGAFFAYRFAATRRELLHLQEQQAALDRSQTELQQQLAQAQGERGRLQKALDQARAEGEFFASQIAELQRQAAGTIAFTLSGGLVRDAGPQQILAIPGGATQVRLLMSIPSDDHPSYAAVIRTPEGAQVWKQASLAARRIGSALSVAVTVPAHLLASGDYILTLNGVTPGGRTETLADFAFRTKRS